MIQWICSGATRRASQLRHAAGEIAVEIDQHVRAVGANRLGAGRDRLALERPELERGALQALAERRGLGAAVADRVEEALDPRAIERLEHR